MKRTSCWDRMLDMPLLFKDGGLEREVSGPFAAVASPAAEHRPRAWAQ